MVMFLDICYLHGPWGTEQRSMNVGIKTTDKRVCLEDGVRGGILPLVHKGPELYRVLCIY